MYLTIEVVERALTSPWSRLPCSRRVRAREYAVLATLGSDLDGLNGGEFGQRQSRTASMPWRRKQSAVIGRLDVCQVAESSSIYWAWR